MWSFCLYSTYIITCSPSAFCSNFSISPGGLSWRKSIPSVSSTHSRSSLAERIRVAVSPWVNSRSRALSYIRGRVDERIYIHTSDAPIIESVMNVSHYRALFLVLVSVISKLHNWYSTNISSGYNPNYLKNVHFHWNNQRPEGRYNIRLVSAIATYIYLNQSLDYWNISKINYWLITNTSYTRILLWKNIYK